MSAAAEDELSRLEAAMDAAEAEAEPKPTPPEPDPGQPGHAGMTPPEPEPDPGQLARDLLPLRGRTALVTGVSRRAGIGYAIARHLAALGASLFLHHYTPHDRGRPWGADPGGIDAVVGGVTGALTADGARVHDAEFDLADPAAPGQLIDAAALASGHLDILV